MAHGTRYSEAELEAMASEFERGEYETVAGQTLVVEADTGGGTSVLSIRLPRVLLAQLKALAEAEGVGATVLARAWITARLASEAPAGAGTVDVGELLSFVAAHMRAS